MRLRQVLIPTLLILLLAGLTSLLAGCGALGVRQQVQDGQARQLLATAVGLAVAGDLDGLCALSPAEATTCMDSAQSLGDVRPATAPTIVCSVAAPDFGPLRNGHVLVLEGTDGADEAYLTEFIAYDDGSQIVVLDAVWWSGVTIVDYTEETVTWGFDSTSQTCERGGLPVTPSGG